LYGKKGKGPTGPESLHPQSLPKKKRARGKTKPEENCAEKPGYHLQGKKITQNSSWVGRGKLRE